MRTPEPISDLVILPQRASHQRVAVGSPNWSFEPFWRGHRLMVRVENGRVSLTDDSGVPMDAAFPDIPDVLMAAVDADQAVLDGIWTVQPFLGQGSAAERWSEAIAGEAGDLPEEGPDPAELETRRAFVAVDLVELDGTSLGDLPYQERRRLLGAALIEGDRVRITPAVKLPVTSWFHAWESNGFQHCVAKHVNSRYHPGELSDEWIILPLKAEAPSSVTGMFWKGRTKKRQISE